jgi:recombination protein RecA
MSRKNTKEVISDNDKLWSDFDNSISNKFGSDALMSEDTVLNVEKTPTGIISLDNALGGGFADGRFVEIMGLESSGKTTISIHAMIGYQQKYPNKAVGVIDFENAFNKEYARNIGLDTSKYKWRLSQPSNAEEGMDILNNMINSGLFSCIVVDSIAAMTPKVELEGNTGDQTMGVHARIMGKVCRVNVGASLKNNVTIIWINQLREKIGVIYGSNETTPGGNSMKFYASQRLKVTKKYLQDKTEKAFSEVEVIKNKVASPFKKASLYMVYGEGIDKTSDLLDACIAIGLVERKGAWFNLNMNEKDKVNLGQGRDATILLLKDNVELYDELKKAVEKHLEENNYIL